MKLLITGAYGLVGSNICKVLERDYPEIETVKVKGSRIVMHTNELLRFINEDLSTYDYVIHAAGYGQPQMFSKDKVKTIEINTTDTITLFNYLNPGGKFLFISSSEIYSGAPSPYKETDIGTTTPQHPRACYIEGKRCGEAICMAYKEQGYDVKIVRLALAYGPGTKKGDTRVINQFIEQALTTGEVKVKDKGEALRTYGYIDDVVTQLLNVLFKGKDVVYNVGGKSKTTVYELAHLICRRTGANLFVGDKSLEGAPDDVELRLDKVLEEFPQELTCFEDGIIKTIEYQKTLYEA